MCFLVVKESLEKAASGLVMVTVEKAVGEGGVPVARQVVGEANSMVPAAGKSTLFFLMRTSPAAILHLSSPCSSFLTLPQIHGYQGTKVSLLQK
jgi:hypothetical protein